MSLLVFARELDEWKGFMHAVCAHAERQQL
jgi:hypothetical protein